MYTQTSFENTAEIYSLLENIKNEYENDIKNVLIKTSPNIYKNPHMIPKLKKIHVNRGLGLAAQNSNFLKKSIEEFTIITGQKPIITRSKKAIAGFKIRTDMELGLTVTLRGKKMYDFFTKLLFFTFAQIRDFRGLSVRSFDKAGNYTLGLKEQLIFPEIEYENIEQIQGLSINLVIGASTPKSHSNTLDRILNGMVLFKFLKFPLNDCGNYEKFSTLSEVNQLWDKKKHLRRKRWSQEETK
uniref:Large ribosomal subunit protein uL5c n=1 Tax=Toxarium undulatum TaxID=210620 RepID=A0A1D8D9M7_9STRA|nr:ribosomal protein L5 [Toxarium undulatum]AOS86658.1 ribosomal protein L5 [Toxarium undulatum]